MAQMIQADLFRDADVEPPVIAAYGGGVDSTAMIIEWVESGRRLDVVLFADTGSEKPATYIMVAIMRAWLAKHGIPLITVRYEPQNFKNYPPYRTLDENCFTNGTLPSISFGFSSCSHKWKVEPQNKWTEAFEPAVAAWAAGKKVIKLIGYDAGPRDSARYAHAEGYTDDRYQYEYPLRDWGWDRERCKERIREAGMMVPPKSACFMCAASKPHEIDGLEPAQLRRIVLMEARAKPRLRTVDGLWRKAVKGKNGATPHPGAMTDYIREKGLLPADEIDEIIALAPEALVRFQQAHADIPVGQRPELSRWMALFDMRDQGAFDADGGRPLYQDVEGLS